MRTLTIYRKVQIYAALLPFNVRTDSGVRDTLKSGGKLTCSIPENQVTVTISLSGSKLPDGVVTIPAGTNPVELRVSVDTLVLNTAMRLELNYPKGIGQPAKSSASGAARKSAQKAHSGDELDAYRPGGARRKEINTTPSERREALLNCIATWASAMVRTQFFDQSGALWQKVKEYGGWLESVKMTFSAYQVDLEFRFANTPESGHTFQYAYNEITNEEGKAPVRLNAKEIEWVQCAALSHLADTAPRAKMKNGWIQA